MPKSGLSIALVVVALIGVGWLWYIGAFSSQSADTGFVSRSTLGERWPLTVESGTLHCEGSAVTFVTGGTTYAVNGTAVGQMERRGWKDIGAIWALAEQGLKKDISPLIDRGLALCS